MARRFDLSKTFALLGAVLLGMAADTEAEDAHVVKVQPYEGTRPRGCDEATSVHLLKACGDYALFEEADAETALAYWSDGLRIAEDAGDLEAIQSMASGIAAIHSARGDYTDAIPFQENAVRAHELHLGGVVDDSFAEHLRDLALLYDRAGLFDKADVIWERLSAVARAKGSRRDAALNLLDLSRHKQALGSHESAIEYYEEAVALLEDEGERGLALSGSAYIVDSYLEVGKSKDAVSVQEREVQLARRLGDPSMLSEALERYAVALRAAGRTADASRAEAEAGALRRGE